MLSWVQYLEEAREVPAIGDAAQGDQKHGSATVSLRESIQKEVEELRAKHGEEGSETWAVIDTVGSFKEVQYLTAFGSLNLTCTIDRYPLCVGCWWCDWPEPSQVVPPEPCGCLQPDT